jgi:hypothetical protein
MLIRLKYVGTGEFNIESGLTYNNVYTALEILEQTGQVRALIIDDNGAMYLTHTIQEPLYWELVSAETIGGVSIYP